MCWFGFGRRRQVLCRRVAGHAEIAGLRGVYEFDDDVVADVGEVPVSPVFKRIGRNCAAALLRGARVAAAGGMGLDFVGGAVEDIDAAAVGLPAGDAGGREAIDGVLDAAVVL